MEKNATNAKEFGKFAGGKALSRPVCLTPPIPTTEPFPNFVLVERLRTVHGGAQHLDGSIACRGMIVGVLLEHRLVVLDALEQSSQ